MLGTLDGPWLPCVALALLAAALWRGRRPPRGELWTALGLAALALAARSLWGLWGPLHVNGQGPLWVRGAMDASLLASYGPGYAELLGWLTRLGAPADRVIFAANAVLSALTPALLYATARLVGVGPGGALALGVALAADAVAIRTAATELYIWPLIALVAAVQLALAVFAAARLRDDRPAAALALAAATLFAIAAARIQAAGYLPLAIAPLVVLGAAEPRAWGARIALSLQAAAAVGLGVVLSSGAIVQQALHAAPVGTHGILDVLLAQHAELLLVAALAVVWIARRWAVPPWLPLLGAASLLAMAVVEAAFQRHPFQAMFYARLCWPGVLLGAAALLPQRLQGIGWGAAAGLVAAAVLQIPALPYLAERTTEQQEYAFLQEVLPAMPATCTLAAVGRAGKRVWDLPAYLAPSGNAREIAGEADLRAALGAAECVVYVHSSLCSSAEGRALCDSAERQAPLQRVASRSFAAAPSDLALPYDRPSVEVVVYRAEGSAAAVEAGRAMFGEGAPITPEYAQALYAEVAALRETDGCRLARFTTQRFQIDVGLQPPSGAPLGLEMAATHDPGRGRVVGDWTLAAEPQLQRDCPATLAAIERALQARAAPVAPALSGGTARTLPPSHALILVCFLLLVAGTVHILRREAIASRPPLLALLLLAGVSAAALALRLLLSPRTFLHEYYHIAETVSAYLTSSDLVATYGQTGPALFRAVALLAGRPDDEQVIFLTNAVLASLAIPALALFDLALFARWPRALCSAVLLCVLPLHLRFSAAEDLFVLAVTFALWSLALFALYLRTRRLADALAAALALALAMQARPEMLFFPAAFVALLLCVRPGEWRMLFDRRTLLAGALLAALLVPRALELRAALQVGPPPEAKLPALTHYFQSLVLFQLSVTPATYWLLLAAGAGWCLWRAPGVLLWVSAVCAGTTLFALSIFDNPPYRLRSQILPSALAMLVAGGAAPLWLALWGRRQRLARALGSVALGAVAVLIVVGWRGFVGELRDQQLEFAFLARTVPQLPERATLLAATAGGGRNIDVFPDFLLRRAGKQFRLVDVRQAASGEAAWPADRDELLYYQGMFCFFAFDDEPAPEPMTAACRAVHQRYVAEPLFVEELAVPGYSHLQYAGDGDGPFRIGFFRLRPRG